MKLSTPIMKPWRYPATAKAAASASRTRSSKSPDTAITVSALRATENDGSAISASAARAELGSVHRVLQTGQLHARREVGDADRIPWPFPAAQMKQPVDHECGESPDQHLSRSECRSGLAGRISDVQPAGRIGEV